MRKRSVVVADFRDPEKPVFEVRDDVWRENYFISPIDAPRETRPPEPKTAKPHERHKALVEQVPIEDEQ